MGTWIAASVVLMFLAGLSLVATRWNTPSTAPAPASSPLDHAERILASRYARKEISAQEYGRMLVVLRK